MTAQKHLKRLVRDRMKKTGESYASARRHTIREAPAAKVDPALRWHFPGNVPGTTALRVLLAHAGVKNPKTGEPFSEAMLFGVCGGIGIGICTFYYEKEDFGSFFAAGRHLWQDDFGYLTNAAERFGLKPKARESTGVKAAEKQLREALEDGPCAALVDMAHLPHRAMPKEFSGGGYHVITIYRIDGDHAMIGDLTDEPIPIPLADLAAARRRIKSYKNRLLSLPEAKKTPDLKALVRGGLAACRKELVASSMPMMKAMFQLDALGLWAERLHGSKDKERWERTFAPGANLWRALTSINMFIEHWGTGGSLCRPLFAEFLAEAASELGDAKLTSLSKRYSDLGRLWGELADAALPDSVKPMREAKELMARKAELTHSEGPDATDEVQAIWSRLDELSREAKAKFPLSESESAQLRADLKKRVLAIHAAEIAACEQLAEVSS